MEFGVEVYVDDQVIVIDKRPASAPAPDADGTLVNGLRRGSPTSRRSAGGPPGIVHRLDIGTSGLLAVARTDLAYDQLVTARAADVGRRYRTLVGVSASPSA